MQVDAGKVSMDFAELAAGDCIAGANGNLWEKLDYSAIKTDGIDPALVQRLDPPYHRQQQAGESVGIAVALGRCGSPDRSKLR